ncbi:hypothetical protein [Marinomonas sp. IMCC 4694]|nr:hypothetical protein [Marinomonas sp. IMCC 4694]
MKWIPNSAHSYQQQQTEISELRLQLKNILGDALMSTANNPQDDSEEERG